MLRRLMIHSATLLVAACALAGCTYHRTVVEEHPIRDRAPMSETTVVVPPNSNVTVQPQ